MGKKLFVGGLPYETSDAQLREIFAACGQVVSAKVIMDKILGRSKGFGFVEMATDDEAKAAMEKLNNSAVGARKIFVNEARPMEPRPPGGAPRPAPGGFGEPRGGFGGGGDKRGNERNFGPDKKPGRGRYDEKKRRGGDEREKRGGFGGKGRKGKEFDDGDDGW